MHGPESSPGRQSGGGSLGVSPLWHAASMRPSLSLVLHGSFPNADPDVVPPMSGVIFEKEHSLCVPRDQAQFWTSQTAPATEPSTLPSLCWLDTEIQEVVSLSHSSLITSPGPQHVTRGHSFLSGSQLQ